MAGCTTSLDPQGDPAGEWLGGGLLDVLRETDLFFPNEKEALAVASRLGGHLPGGVDEQLLETLSYLGPLPVVKCGAEGALSCDGKAIVRAAAVRTVAVDTIGAGDSFDAGFVYGRLQGWPVDRSLAFAVACGSLSTRTAGGVEAQPSVTEALAMSGDIEVTRPSV